MTIKEESLLKFFKDTTPVKGSKNLLNRDGYTDASNSVSIYDKMLIKKGTITQEVRLELTERTTITNKELPLIYMFQVEEYDDVHDMLVLVDQD
jgi:hypothetical protein